MTTKWYKTFCRNWFPIRTLEEAKAIAEAFNSGKDTVSRDVAFLETNIWVTIGKAKTPGEAKAITEQHVAKQRTVNAEAERKQKANGGAEPAALVWTDVSELGAKASAGGGWEYHIIAYAFMGGSGIGAGGYDVYCMPTKTSAEKMKDYKIPGKAKTLQEAMALAEEHFARKQKERR